MHYGRSTFRSCSRPKKAFTMGSFAFPTQLVSYKIYSSFGRLYTTSLGPFWTPQGLIPIADFPEYLNKLFKVLASVFIFYSIQTSTITGVFYSIQVQKRHYSDSLFRIIHIQDTPCCERHLLGLGAG